MKPAGTSPETASPPPVRRRVACLCILGLALVLFSIRTAVAFHNPFFPGDAGHRMQNSYTPLVRLGNRLWLPVLQAHIWVFHLLGMPYYAFKIIPCFYFLVAVAFLGVMAWELTGRNYAGLVFALLLMLCFAHQKIVLSVSVQPYQEIVGAAFFYVLLWGGALELRRSKPLLATAVVALLTREVLWVDLLAVSLLNWKQIVSQKSYRRTFFLLWSVPALWLASIPFGYLLSAGRFPRFLVEWPLGINKAGSQAVSGVGRSLASFWTALVFSRTIYLVGGLMVVWVLARVLRPAGSQPTGQRGGLESRFRSFSLVSLGLTCSLVVLFDPWEYTFGNDRMAFPLVAHGFIWAILLFRDTFWFPAAARFLARGILAAGLVLAVGWGVRGWLPEDYSQVEARQAEIAGLVKAAGRGGQATVCVKGADYFDAVRTLIAPTLYARRRFLGARDEIPGTCDLIITPSDYQLASGGRFVKHKDYQLGSWSCAVYRRSGRQ